MADDRWRHGGPHVPFMKAHLFRDAMKGMPVFLAAAVAAAAAADSLPPVEAGSAACSCIDWWQTKLLRMGHPNTLDRRDRTTARFELSPYLLAGRVAKAELCLTLNSYGIKDRDEFVVQRLVRNREAIRSVDTLSEDAEEIARFAIRAGERNPTRCRLDVTAAVNGLRASGHVQLVVRVCDETAERRGNPEHVPHGAEIANGGFTLEVKP